MVQKSKFVLFESTTGQVRGSGRVAVAD